MTSETTYAVPGSKLALTVDEVRDRATIYDSSRAFVLSGKELQAFLASTDPGVAAIQANMRRIMSAAEAHRDVVMLARRQNPGEGKEIDDSALVADSDSNGAYVQAWLWVPFADTALDKEAEAQVATHG